MNDYLLGGLIGAGAALIILGVVTKVIGKPEDDIDLIDISRPEDELKVIKF